MPRFAIQNTEARLTSRDIKYENTKPNAFILSTNFESPLVITCVATEPQDV